MFYIELRCYLKNEYVIFLFYNRPYRAVVYKNTQQTKRVNSSFPLIHMSMEQLNSNSEQHNLSKNVLIIYVCMSPNMFAVRFLQLSAKKTYTLNCRWKIVYWRPTAMLHIIVANLYGQKMEPVAFFPANGHRIAFHRRTL